MIANDIRDNSSPNCITAVVSDSMLFRIFEFNYHQNINVIRREPSRILDGFGGEVLVNCFLLQEDRILLAMQNNTVLLDEKLNVLSKDKHH